MTARPTGHPKVRERTVHKAVLAFLMLRLSPAARATLNHAPNEVDLSVNERSRSIALSKAKALGMQPGYPDLSWLGAGGRFHAFEVKTPVGRLSPAQEACGAAIEAAGGRWAVVRSVDEAEAVLRAWEAAE